LGRRYYPGFIGVYCRSSKGRDGKYGFDWYLLANAGVIDGKFMNLNFPSITCRGFIIIAPKPGSGFKPYRGWQNPSNFSSSLVSDQ